LSTDFDNYFPCRDENLLQENEKDNNNNTSVHRANLTDDDNAADINWFSFSLNLIVVDWKE
jgi:hypothetical protein